MTTAVRVGRFWGVGLAGIGVQMATLAILTHVLSVHYAAATFIAVGAAIVHNFLWHRVWTWADRRAHVSAPIAFTRFVAANGLVSIAGNLGLMAVFVSVGNMPVLAANAIAIAVCGLVNYWAGDRIVFARTATSAR